MGKIKITKEQAIMLENLNKKKVIKITESQYKKLVESLNPGKDIDRAFQTAMQGDKDFMKNRNKLDEGLWESFINELYGINESSEKVYESLIKIMEACGYVENKKLSKAKFGGDKKMAKNVILGGLQTLHETGSPFMAMEAMEDVFKSQLTQRSGEKPSQQQIVNKIKDIRANVLKGRAERGEPLSVGRKGDETPTPEPVDPNQLKMDLSEIDGEEDAPTKMVPINPESEDAVDTITMDVPLFIRALEYSREDAKSDITLHDIAQNAIMLSKEYGMLTMDNYDEIFGSLENVEPKVEPQSPELNEVDVPGGIDGLDILKVAPFSRLPETRREMGDYTTRMELKLPSLDNADAKTIMFSKQDFDDHEVQGPKTVHEFDGYVTIFNKKFGEDPIFVNIVDNGRFGGADIANEKFLEWRNQGIETKKSYMSKERSAGRTSGLDEESVDEVTAMGGPGGVFGGDGVNPKSGSSTFPVAPLGYKAKEIKEALDTLKKK